MRSTHNNRSNYHLANKRVYQFTEDYQRTKVTFNSIRLGCEKLGVSESKFKKRIKERELLDGFYYSISEEFIPKAPIAF